MPAVASLLHDISAKRGMLGSPIFPSWRYAEPEGSAPSRPAWLHNQPIQIVGGWEPLSFRRRAGYAWADEGEYLKKEFDDAALKRFVGLGVKCIHIPFAKGFGLEAVAEEMEMHKDITDRAHALGLKVAHYYRVDAVVPDTMEVERPDVRDWVARGMYGRTSIYSSQQSWRKRICLLHPGAVEWVEQVIRHGIEELDSDLMHLDGFFVAYHPWETCRCERCLTSYRQWLKMKYADRAHREKVFGLIDFDRVEFPEFEPNASLPTVATAPEVRAWHEHQWDKQFAFARHIRRYIHSLNPEVGMLVNLGWYRNANYYRQLSLLPERIFPWIDIVGLEDDFELSYTPERIVSRIGLLKSAREYGALVYNYHHSNIVQEVEGSMALSLASNGGSMGMIGFVHRYLPSYQLAEESKIRFSRWMESNWDLFRDAEQAGCIALLRHHRSLAWNAREPWFAAMAMEQLLVQMKVAWRMLDQIDPVMLADVRTLIVPEMDCLSSEELEVLRAWVEQGGNLFFTFRTGLFDGDRQRRSQHPIMKWADELERDFNEGLGPADWFEWSVEDYEVQLEVSHRRGREPRIVSCGAGRLGFWPAVRTNLTGCTLSRRILAPDVCLPEHHQEIEKFLLELSGTPELRVAGEGLLTECTRHRDGSGLFVHLINLLPDSAPARASIRLSESAVAAKVLSPDKKQPVFSMSPDGIMIADIQRYAVVVISPKGASA